MSDSEIVRTLAEKVMGWKLRDTRPTQVSEHPYYEWRPRGELCIWPHWGAYGTVWNPLKNIADAFQILNAGEWDYVIRKSRSDGLYHVWIINSVWAENHRGELPEPGNPNLYGYGYGEELARAISNALVAVEGKNA